jgi:hypothetical protein
MATASAPIATPPAPSNNGPQNFQQAHDMFAAQGNHLIAVFHAEPTGNLSYTGLVPLEDLVHAGFRPSDYLPTADDRALLRKGKMVSSYVAVQTQEQLFRIYARSVTVGKLPGSKIPVMQIPTKLHQVPVVLTFSIQEVIPSASGSASASAFASDALAPTPGYAQARALYDDFVVKVGKLVRLSFVGQVGPVRHVLPPSQLSQMMWDEYQSKRQLLTMTIGPICTAKGEVMALSKGADGKPVSVKQFEGELDELEAQYKKAADELQAAVTETNDAIVKLAEKHGTTARALYLELNKRAGENTSVPQA